jgi:hypothetical protein
MDLISKGKEVSGHYRYGEVVTEESKLVCPMHVDCLTTWWNVEGSSPKKCPTCNVKLVKLNHHEFFNKHEKITIPVSPAIQGAAVALNGAGGTFALQILGKWTIRHPLAMTVVYILWFFLCSFLGMVSGLSFFLLLTPYCAPHLIWGLLPLYYIMSVAIAALLFFHTLERMDNGLWSIRASIERFYT